MTTALSEPVVSVRVTLSPELLARYEQQARSAGVDVERLLADRLAMAVGQQDQKPLYFGDADRQKIEALLNQNFSKPAEVIKALSRAVELRINGVSVNVPPDVLERLKTRHVDGS